jgi:ATP-dependent RNA helicase SUPV3L1/SUV3
LRLERWLQRHIANVIEPIIKLSEAEDLTGISRGIAFRLVENMWVIAREDIVEEVKSLSQDERGLLRKYGVRFGAFHIFMPSLLKPAPTELRLLLWALLEEKQGHLNRDTLAEPPGQGLTSVLFDNTTPKGFYRTLGFRICGTRAVRIDMLERLGDLIRERVFWRPRFPEEARPAGSMEGGGFMVIPDMMSLVGCSGDEFAGVLRSLGFRMDKRKKPEPIVAAKTEEAPASVEQAEAEQPEADQANAESPQEETPAAPATEPEMIEVWWPKDTGPFRQKAERKKPEAAKSSGKPRQDHKKHGKAGSRQKPDHRKPRPPRPEKPIDKDSPFAVLGALKAELSKKA